MNYWRTSTGQEVDFILGDKEMAVAVKSGSRVHEGDLKGMRALAEDGAVGRRVLVCQESYPRMLDGVEVLPWREFLDLLWSGSWRK